MARTQIAQCDICGAHESEDNPIGATVTLRGKKDVTDDYVPSFFRPISEPTERLDLCMGCSAPLVHMLRDHAARRRQQERRADRVKPANTITHDAFVRTVFGIKTDGN